MRHFDSVIDRKVPHIRHVLADAYGVALLLDPGFAKRLVRAALSACRIQFRWRAHPREYALVHPRFLVNSTVARRIGHFQAAFAVAETGERPVEFTGDRRPALSNRPAWRRQQLPPHNQIIRVLKEKLSRKSPCNTTRAFALILVPNYGYAGKGDYVPARSHGPESLAFEMASFSDPWR